MKMPLSTSQKSSVAQFVKFTQVKESAATKVGTAFLLDHVKSSQNTAQVAKRKVAHFRRFLHCRINPRFSFVADVQTNISNYQQLKAHGWNVEEALDLYVCTFLPAPSLSSVPWHIPGSPFPYRGPFRYHLSSGYSGPPDDCTSNYGACWTRTRYVRYCILQSLSSCSMDSSAGGHD